MQAPTAVAQDNTNTRARAAPPATDGPRHDEPWTPKLGTEYFRLQGAATGARREPQRVRDSQKTSRARNERPDFPTL